MVSDVGARRLRPIEQKPIDLAVRRPAYPVYQAKDVFASSTAPAYVHAGDFGELPEHPPHTHDFLEIIVVAEGQGVHVGSNGVTELSAGSVVVIRPGAWHALRERRGLVAATIGISSTTLVSDLSFLRMRSLTRELLNTAPSAIPGRAVWVTRISPADARVVVDETRAFSAFLERNSGDNLRITGRLIAILGGLADALPKGPQPSHPAVISVLHQLEAAPQRRWDTAELAHSVNLEKTYLIRLFRAQVGMPPITYLSQLRTERSASLLATTDLPIAAIAATVGWPDPAYFARRFHALVGLTPSDYRRQTRAVPSAS